VKHLVRNDTVTVKHLVRNDTVTVNYPVHVDIITTTFYIGEPSDADSGFISNTSSAWDEEWVKNYGGIDDPRNRNGYHPAGFIPKENPFYFALPYNDMNENGNRRSDAVLIYWHNKTISYSDNESIVKNKWIKISKGTKSAYAQWEDNGPWLRDDVKYVFGTSAPSNTNGAHAGLDVSPAVRDYIGLLPPDVTDWQFVDDSNVPNGPWKQIITTSEINWLPKQ
jgi:hypothetical protein